jgi:hypothetical protein
VSGASPVDIPFARHDAARGVVWLRQAFVMLSAYRGQWLMMLLTYYFIIAMVDVVPYLGQLVAPLLKPVFAVGFLAAAWSQERGEAPRMRHLFQGFRANLWALLPLGLVFLVGVTAAVFASYLVDGGKLLEVLSGTAKVDDTLVSSGDVQAAMLFSAVCALPVLLAMWFAPALVVFQDCSAGRALATSLRAAIANWRPIGVYALLVFFYGGVLPGMATALIAALVPKEAAFLVAVFVLMPYLFMLVATLHISDYVSYRDVFHPGEQQAAPASPDPDAAA